MLSNNGYVYVYAACAECVCVTIFSTGSVFRPVSNFMEVHALITLPARSYALLHVVYVNFDSYSTHGLKIDITSLTNEKLDQFSCA